MKMGKAVTETHSSWPVYSNHIQLCMLCSYVHLPGVLSEEELQEHIDPVYEDFLHRRIEVPGKSWTAQYPSLPLFRGPRCAASVHLCIVLLHYTSASFQACYLPEGWPHMPIYNDVWPNCLIFSSGKDVCDMSGNTSGRTPEQYTLYNVMLPRKHSPKWQGNLFERRCKAIADQLQVYACGKAWQATCWAWHLAHHAHLQGGQMEVDYDQILAKR